MTPSGPGRCETGKTPMATDAKPFPASERVFYAKAPLIEVVAQLRFPPILRIQEQPSDFQDRVRKFFPLFDRAMPAGLPQDIPAEMLQILSGQGFGAPGYKFLTEDRREFLTLFVDSFAYSTEKYTTWENFRAVLELGVNSLMEVYQPS